MSDLSSIIHGRNGKISKTKAGAILGAAGAIGGALLGQLSWPEAIAALLGCWQTYSLKVAVDNSAAPGSPGAPPAS